MKADAVAALKGASTGAGTGTGNGQGSGQEGGGATASDLGWYGAMIHDRFYSRWQQPTSVVAAAGGFVATVKIRIEKDGRVSEVTLAKSSGNVVMDDSVMTAARLVKQIDPLPAQLKGPFYEINVEFKLTQTP